MREKNDKKISELPEKTILEGDEYIPVVMDGQNFKAKASLFGSASNEDVDSIPTEDIEDLFKNLD